MCNPEKSSKIFKVYFRISDSLGKRLVLKGRRFSRGGEVIIYQTLCIVWRGSTSKYKSYR